MREAIARGLDGPGIRYFCCNLTFNPSYFIRGPCGEPCMHADAYSLVQGTTAGVASELSCQCSPLDVHPETWAHVPGFEEELAHRRAKLAAVKVRP